MLMPIVYVWYAEKKTCVENELVIKDDPSSLDQSAVNRLSSQIVYESIKSFLPSKMNIYFLSDILMDLQFKNFPSFSGKQNSRARPFF